MLITDHSMSTIIGEVFRVGDAIKNCRHLRGRVTSVNMDGTYDVVYNNRQWDKNLSFEQLTKSKIAILYNDVTLIFV